MLEDASNQDLLSAWREGNERAALVLVRRYMTRLTALARARLSRKLARRLDSEDIVMSAWRSFFAAAGRDQIAVPDDDNLWPLLVTMTLRKLARQAERHTASKRSVNEEVASESWPEVVARDPTPDEAAMVTDEVESLMAALSQTDRDILNRRLQGEEHAAIAAATGCSERTVRRALQRARTEFLARQPEGHESALAVEPVVPADVIPEKTPTAGIEAEAAQRRSVSLPQASFGYGDIVLEQLIGQGTFGRVFRSRLQDGQTVAVKFLRKHLWQDSLAAEQLIREVSIVSGLSHPGIVQHLGWGKTDAGAVFSVMEFVDGQDLDRWQADNALSEGDILSCGEELCEAVTAAHQRGVIHGDLTPGNVLRRNDGHFVLTDFGFSKIAGDPLPVPAGTPGFLAPEQLSDAFGSVSPRTDVFGIGSILCFLSTGRPPVAASSISDSVAATLSARPVDLDVEFQATWNSLRDIVACCLAKEPSDRPSSVETVLAELRGTGAS